MITDIWRYSFVLVNGLLAAVSGSAQNHGRVDLTEVTLEELANVQVTSVSRKEQSLSKTGAAVFVITQEDIRHSGATNMPDLLRMVPGVNVARIDANAYAVSIRGFNSRLADKVLVLIDGRTVYTPTTSGVYWDQLDVPLEDIERIEVIRGPGGTVWGANAMNGVINIITKKAGDTKGLVVRAGGGSQGTANGLVQYGGPIGRKGDYRVFANYANTGNTTSSSGNEEAADGFHLLHTGFRSDWNLSTRDTATLQGDLIQVKEGQAISVVFSDALPLMRTFNDAVTVGEGNLLGRWKHVFQNGSDTSLQVYYDKYNRYDEGVRETLDTVDVDLQHHLRLGSRNNVVWGVGYRHTSDTHLPGYGKTYIPLDQANSLFSTFIQDEIKIRESLSLTLGTKLENQPYAGFQYEPSAQLVWTPTARQTLWFSASRAIKQVSREAVGLQLDPYTFPLPGGSFGLARFNGNPAQRAEQLHDFEIGYRGQFTKKFSMDLTTFSGYYRDLQTLDPGQPYFTTGQGVPHLVLPSVFGNSANAHSYGVEFSANWNVNRSWRISPGYSTIRLKILPHPGSRDVYQLELAANTPENQIQVRSEVKLWRHLELDSALYYVGRLRDGGDGDVPAYTRVDTRLGWRPGESVEFSLVGQNLLTPHHAEFHNAFEVSRTLVDRTVFAKLTWHF